MVATCIRARDCAGREPAAAVGLQRFKPKTRSRFWHSSLSIFIITHRHWRRGLGGLTLRASNEGLPPVLTRPPSRRRDAAFPDRPRVARARRPPNLCRPIPRSVESASPPIPSSLFGDSHRCRRRCLHGNIRRREPRLARCGSSWNLAVSPIDGASPSLVAEKYVGEPP